MKLLLQVIFLFGILIFVKCQCSFTIDQLDGQILTTVKKAGCGDKCFTSNVKLTIINDSKKITQLKLTAVDSSSPLKSAKIKPASESLKIDQLFLVENTLAGQATNFLQSCKNQNINGNKIQNLSFSAQVDETEVQSFELKYGSSSSGGGGSGSASSSTLNSLILKLSLALIFSLILLF